MLSCDLNGYDFAFFYESPNDFSVYESKRGKRCCSCHEHMVRKGDECLRFERYRDPVTDIEERISGSEVPLAPYFMCEECGELFFTFKELGYCVVLDGSSMQENLKEYQYMVGFTEIKEFGRGAGGISTK